MRCCRSLPTSEAAIPAGTTLCRAASWPKRGQSAARAPPARSSARTRKALVLEEDTSQLVLLARLEDREHLVAGFETGRPARDLRLPVPHYRDELGALRQAEALDLLAGARRVLVDLHLDDLEVLLAQLEEVDQLVLGHLVLDEREDVRGRRDGRGDSEQVEMGLIPRVVDSGDHLRDAVLVA